MPGARHRMHVDPITSTDNRWLKRVRKAAERHREEIVVEGPKQIRDALTRGLSPIAILVREGSLSQEGWDAPVTLVVGERAFASLGDTSTSQGIIALFERPHAEAKEVLADPGPVVVLDGVQDPGNVGAIVRLAAAFDATGVIALSGCADPFSPRAIRGSVGTALTMRIATSTPAQLLDDCSSLGRSLFAAMPSGPSITRGLPADAVIVLGSEGHGVSEALAEAATPFSIPTSGRVESLNVSTAAAIVLWELSGRTRL